jgi:hypothetical protein
LTAKAGGLLPFAAELDAAARRFSDEINRADAQVRTPHPV